jgi:hypothetical protein
MITSVLPESLFFVQIDQKLKSIAVLFTEMGLKS